jgi:hypothetical protein
MADAPHRLTMRATDLAHRPPRGARLAYDVALIGNIVTTGASQAMASAGGEGSGCPEADTGADGPCSMDICCCPDASAGTPKVPMGSLLGCVGGHTTRTPLRSQAGRYLLMTEKFDKLYPRPHC